MTASRQSNSSLAFEPVIPGDFRSPVVEPALGGLDMQSYLAALCAEPSTLCDHREYDALRNYKASPMDDHETLDAQCRTCGEYVKVTIWYTRDEVDMRPLTQDEIAEYFA